MLREVVTGKIKNANVEAGENEVKTEIPQKSLNSIEYLFAVKYTD